MGVLMSDWKFGHEGANSKEPSAAYLKSVGLDPASEALAKAADVLAKFENALAAISDLNRRIDALIERDAEAASSTRKIREMSATTNITRAIARARADHAKAVLAVKRAYPPGHQKRLGQLRLCDAGPRLSAKPSAGSPRPASNEWLRLHS